MVKVRHQVCEKHNFRGFRLGNVSQGHRIIAMLLIRKHKMLGDFALRKVQDSLVNCVCDSGVLRSGILGVLNASAGRDCHSFDEDHAENMAASVIRSIQEFAKEHQVANDHRPDT